MSSGQRLKGLHYTKNNLDLLGLSPSGTLADFMCTAWRSDSLIVLIFLFPHLGPAQ